MEATSLRCTSTVHAHRRGRRGETWGAGVGSCGLPSGESKCAIHQHPCTDWLDLWSSLPTDTRAWAMADVNVVMDYFMESCLITGVRPHRELRYLWGSWRARVIGGRGPRHKTSTVKTIVLTSL